MSTHSSALLDTVREMTADELSELRRLLGSGQAEAPKDIGAELMTVRDAAKRADCHPETLRRAIHAQRLAASRVGSTWRISAADLGAWLQPSSSPIASASPVDRRRRQRPSSRQRQSSLSTADAWEAFNK